MNSKQTVKMNTAYASSATSFREFLNCWIFESHNPRTKSARIDRLDKDFSGITKAEHLALAFANTTLANQNFNAQGDSISIASDYDYGCKQMFDAADQTLNRVYMPQSADSPNLFDHRYEFDSMASITQCTTELENFTENITYARLNRLTDATSVGASTVAVRYDDLGTTTNHTTSSDLSDSGAYGYVTQDGFTSEASLASDKETAVTLVVIANDAAERL